MVYLFYGPESFTRREKYEEFISLMEEKNDVLVERVFGDDENVVKKSIDVLSSSPLFFQKKKVVLLHRAEEMEKKDLSFLIERCASEKEGVLFISASWTEKQYEKQKKGIESYIAKTQYFEKLSGEKLRSYLSKRAKKRGVFVEREAISFLHTIYGDSVSLLAYEIDRLSLLKKRIGKKDVSSLPEHREEMSLYEASRDLLGASLLKRLATFERLRIQGVGVDTMFYYLSAVASKKSLIERLSDIDVRVKRGEEIDLAFLSSFIFSR